MHPIQRAEMHTKTPQHSMRYHLSSVSAGACLVGIKRFSAKPEGHLAYLVDAASSIPAAEENLGQLESSAYESFGHLYAYYVYKAPQGTLCYTELLFTFALVQCLEFNRKVM